MTKEEQADIIAQQGLFSARLRALLAPGDVILYNGTGFFSWLIRTKTWSDVSHVETYIGMGFSAASRDGKGVNTYPLRLDGIQYILRPTMPIDYVKGMNWHASVKGQGYDWLGLLAFVNVDKDDRNKMFCSEHATYLARAFGLEPFVASLPAVKVAPATFLLSRAHVLIATVSGEYSKGTAHVAEAAALSR